MTARLGAMDQPAWLDAWVAESRIAGRPAAMGAARAAMHAAAGAATPSRRRLLPALVLAPRRHPWRLVGAGLAAAAGVAVAVGWNAPAGSPLHQVRLGREDLALALARGSSGTELRLQYAEDRLHEARAGVHQADTLAEAESLLDQARGSLPADQGDPLWRRWEVDEGELRGRQTLLASPPPSAPISTPGEDGSASPSTGRSDGDGGSSAGSDAGGSHGGAGSASRSAGDGSGSESAERSSSSGEGGGDSGGRDPGPGGPTGSGGGSTISSASTSETGDGGRGGPSPGGGGGGLSSTSGSSSRSSTSSDDHRSSTSTR